MSRIFLKEKLTIAHFIGLVLTIIGVIFISKPTVLFPHETTLNSTKQSISSRINCTNTTNCLLVNQNAFNFEDFKPILGVSLALCGSCASGVVYLVLKKVFNFKFLTK